MSGIEIMQEAALKGQRGGRNEQEGGPALSIGLTGALHQSDQGLLYQYILKCPIL